MVLEVVALVRGYTRVGRERGDPDNRERGTVPPNRPEIVRGCLHDRTEDFRCTRERERVRPEGDPCMDVRPQRHTRDRPPRVRRGEGSVSNLAGSCPPHEQTFAAAVLPCEIEYPRIRRVDCRVVSLEIHPGAAVPVAG